LLRRFSTNFAIFSIALDGIVVLCSIELMSILRVWMNRLSFIATIPGQVTFPQWLYFVFPLVWVVVLATFSIYDSKKFFKVVDELSTLTMASFIAAISQAGILYLTYRDFSRALFLLVVLFSYLLCVFWRLIFRLVFRLRKETLHDGQRILILGVGPELRKVEKLIKGSLTGKLEQVTILDLKSHPDFAAESPASCAKTIALIRAEVERTSASDVIITFPRNAAEWIGAISSALEDMPLGVWVALDYFDLSFANTYVENLGGLPLLDLRAPALNEYARVLKRGFDLVTATLCFLLLSPLMLITGLIVLIDAGWPIFFLQKRVGENGRLFSMVKFRTMVRDAEEMRAQVEHVDENGALIHKSRNDPRVTRSGRFLRRFSLDELPQLINVIKGEMSLVGPRPELPYLTENYDHWQRRRLAVPPGITGWWQVNGRSDRVMHLHTEDDIYYVENYSIWLDLRILIRTVWVVIMGNGSF
jgi:exopolysaccharide biosynthesis polyprenyl glycosylphosphotransferase